MKNAARVALALALLAPVSASADDSTQTTSVNTLVVVTPNAPVVIQQGQGPGVQQGPGAQQASEMEAPPAATAAPAAPQNEDWNNVSHINGSIVPVGERGDYLMKFKKTNISTNPLGWMFGFYGVSASYAVSNNVVVRGDINIGHQFEGNDGVEVGASLPIYFRRAYSGPFIEPGLVMRSIQQTSYAYDAYGNTTTSSMSTNSNVLVEMMVGWHWSFDSGLNLAMAFGAAREISNTSGTSNSDEPHPAGYFRIGYEF